MEKIKKLVKAGDAIVKAGESIASDGKIDFTDAQHLPKFVGPIQDLYEVFQDVEGLKKEAIDYLEAKLMELKA